MADGVGVERADFIGIPYSDRDRAVRFYGETLGIRRNELFDPTKVGREFVPSPAPIATR